MNDKEAIEMMQRCASEIRLQRDIINALEPRARAFDVIEKIIGYLPGQSRGYRGYSEDLVWVLEKRIKELEANPAEPA